MNSLKMKRSSTVLVFAAALIVFASCATQGPKSYPRLNGEKVRTTAFGSPDTTALVFGYVSLPALFGKVGVENLEFAQLNPAGDAMFLCPGQIGNVVYFEPVPVGSCLHLVYWAYTMGRTTYYSNQGLQRGHDVTINVTKPGLHYAGAYDLTSGSKKLSFGLPGDYGFYPDTESTELGALKKLLSKVKGTDWEAVVANRIKELEDAK